MQPNDFARALAAAIDEADAAIATNEQTHETDPALLRQARELMVTTGGLYEANAIPLEEAVERLSLLLSVIR